jgi:serine/threonine protein kinase
MTSSLCPYCNASVAYGSSPCALCGAALEWNALPDGFRLRYGQGIEIVRTLGRGGFGVTYLADARRGSVGARRVAVKECFPDGLVTRDSNGNVIPKPGCETEFADVLDKFLLEARLLNQIRHPVSTDFVALWQANNTAYLMMEFIEGETLEARIAKGLRLTEFEAITLLEPILDLLGLVHGMRLLHRDIKPANIMLTKDGVELIDFGSAIKFDPKKSTTITSKMLTPAYAPLELYGSQVKLGPSSDLYSLAASVYEAMTGLRVPSALDRSNGAVVQPLEAVLNTVSREFSKLIARALELRIDDRFADAQEMRAALRGVPVFSRSVSGAGNSGAGNLGANPGANPGAGNSSTVTLGRFRLPRWALVMVGIAALIVAAGQLLAFREWQTKLEQTRLDREQFIADQCEMLKKGVASSFICGLRVEAVSDSRVMLLMSVVDLMLQRQGQSTVTVRGVMQSLELKDFVYELAGNTMDLYDRNEVDVVAFEDPLDKASERQFRIDRAGYAAFMAQTATPAMRELRDARALRRLKMPSNETFLQLVGRREIEQSEFGQKWGLKIDSLTWNTDGFPFQTSDVNGASVFVEVPGDDDVLGRDVLMLAKDAAFRLGLRDTVLRLHRALSDAPYIAVFIGKQKASAVWSVSTSAYSDDEFAQLAKASNAQLNDIWRFSSESLPPIRADGYPAEYNAVSAWVIPVQTGSKRPEQPSVLGVLQATEMYVIGRDKREFQAAAQLEAKLIDSRGKTVQADVIDYGNAKLVWACCVNPNQDFKLEYTASDGLFSASEPFSDSVLAQRRFDLKPLDNPPRWLRLRLSQDRSAVILECDPQYGMSGVVVQVKPENVFTEAVFTDSVEAPAKEYLSDCKMTVPFKKFGETNTVRVLRLGFSSDSLLIQDRWGKGEWAQAQKLSASALETTAITRDQLIGLRRGENLEFGPNLKWVKK